jgi:parvulin-like peptidyl-prolyl isomerase
MSPKAYLAFLFVFFGVISCQSEPEQQQDLSEFEDSEVPESKAIATIDGRNLSADVLRDLVEKESGGRTKEQLLDDMILAEVLLDRAVTEGYGNGAGYRLAVKRALVQRLLEKEVEEKATPQGVAEAAVEEYYTSHKLQHYYTPEMRSADHLLIRPISSKWGAWENKAPKEVYDKAEALVAKIRQDIVENSLPAKTAKDFRAIEARWKDRLPEDLEAVVESLPPFPKREIGKGGQPGYIGTVVESFADAVFVSGEGDLSPVVMTNFGAHLISMTSKVPTVEIPIAEAEAGIRQHLSQEDRKILSIEFSGRMLKKYASQVAIDNESLKEAFKSKK